MRFRRRVTLFPGVTINLSKSGFSTTIGPRGASVNFGRNGAFLNTSIPGTGLYDRKRIGGKSRSTRQANSNGNPSSPNPQPLFIQPIASDTTLTGSHAIQELNRLITQCTQFRAFAKHEELKINQELRTAGTLDFISKLLLFGWIFPYFRKKKKRIQDDLEKLRKDVDLAAIQITIPLSETEQPAWEQLRAAFTQLKEAGKAWDLTGFGHMDQIREKLAYAKQWIKQSVSLKIEDFEGVETPEDALCLPLSPTGGVYFYPAFLLIRIGTDAPVLFLYSDVQVSGSWEKIPIYDSVPQGAEIVGSTWLKVNKDGTPDRRFRENKPIPEIGLYKIDLQSTGGLNESWCFVDKKAAEAFYTALRDMTKVFGLP